ncbi:MAG: phosphoribosylanthranilate isomerase [Moraxellaceae bacterium]|nr:phosphoribosylanthranilate isomerase [Moraxellaceae bacterium]MDZ4387006.1 phosphoribosylanthranilate isomerase [Moraxellaceae bacterium]
MSTRDLSRTRVKICGITRLVDVDAAVNAGADALGFVFYAPSPRAVTVEQASPLVMATAPFVSTVGLFVDADAEYVRTVLTELPLSLLQFHGEEDNAFCASFGKPWIKALRVRPEDDVAARMLAWPDAHGFLLDAWHPSAPGGTGHQFNWQQVPQQSAKPLILAGGLTADNVGLAIRSTKPFAVDVSGGVEYSHGIKDASKINAFMAGVRSL